MVPKENCFSPTETSVGVFAKRTIQKNVQFGPFVGELVTKDNVMNTRFPLAVSKKILLDSCKSKFLCKIYDSRSLSTLFSSPEP